MSGNIINYDPPKTIKNSSATIAQEQCSMTGSSDPWARVKRLGFGFIWFASRQPKVAVDTHVTLKVDLPAQTKIEQMTCKNCGGALKAENIKMVDGAPTVECPFCGTTYQLVEEPKW